MTGESPNKSSSSATGSGLFYSFFYSLFSYFLSCFVGFFSFGLKALWASLGRSLGPIVSSLETSVKYQARIFGYDFLSSSPRRVVKTTDIPVAIEISAIES